MSDDLSCETIALRSQLRNLALAVPNFATLEILPANGNGQRRRIVGTFDSFASPRLTFITGERLDVSTAVALEHNDVLFVGEVLQCTAESGGQWTIGIKVAHTLTSLQSLMILRAQLQKHQTSNNDIRTVSPMPVCSS
jgi:hypothetical protein